MELKRVDALLLKILYFLAAGIVLCQVLGQDAFTSILFTLTFPTTLLIWLRTVRKTLVTTDILVLLIIAVAAICVLLNALFTQTVITFNYVKKLIMFITSLLFLQTANKLRLGEDMVRFINRTVDALTLFLIAMYFLNTSQMYVMNGKLTTYLTFGFTNPNLTGLFLVCLYMLETYRLFTKENVWRKLAHVIMAVALAWFVIASRSRNCLLALLMYTAICAWLIFKGHDKMRITKAVALGIAVLPALFVLVYVTLVHSEWVMDAFSFLVDEGKLLDSRTRIWLQALEQIKQSPIIGAYSQISNGTGTGHMHNSHLDMASSYGIPVLCMTIVLLYRYLYQRGRSYTDKKGYTYIWGFACAVMLGIGEAALVSGGMGIYVFMGTFLLLTPNTDAGVAP